MKFKITQASYLRKGINMYKIVNKTVLNPQTVRLVIDAPLMAKKAEPGQFVILRADSESERIPLTISDYDRENGTITIIFQVVGASTQRLNALNTGDSILDFAGPLGRPTETKGIKKAAVIGGGVGCAIAYPVAKKLHMLGAQVHSIAGFRSENFIILQKEFENVSDVFKIMTDDGSYGEKGLVTDALKALIEGGESYNEVFAIGPLVMMKFVTLLTKQYGIKTSVSMNPIMIDGTGMCGCCRLTVNGETKFACIDGPDFDAFSVDFDEVIARTSAYKNFERQKYEETCNLFNKAVL